MEFGTITGLLFTIIVVTLIVTLGRTQKKMTNLHKAMRGYWYQIEDLSTERYNMVPSLNKPIKRYCSGSMKELAQVTKARKEISVAETPEEIISADNLLTSALDDLLAIANKNPELVKDFKYQEELAKLTDIEDRMELADQNLQRAIDVYNAYLDTFPANKVHDQYGFGYQEELEPLTRTTETSPEMLKQLAGEAPEPEAAEEAAADETADDAPAEDAK